MLGISSVFSVPLLIVACLSVVSMLIFKIQTDIIITYVITFALEDDKTFNPEERVLGDIYISIEKAISQSLEYNHSLERELCFLAVHGLLHLLGYDHIKKEEEEVMFKLQGEILDEMGIKK